MNINLDQIAAALPGYEIGAELGRGGWGVVLKGTHRQLGREVAIKQLPGASSDPSVRARFVAEARALASLDHPHVVPIYDYVERDDLCLLVMENLPGGTVWTRFTTEGLTLPAVCAIAMATCSGLECAHKSGILHRDVKPENLLFTGSSTLKVTDFGIAKMMSGNDTKATRAGEVLGTPAYMAPEQVRNGELTPATDVYAVGTMLYELLSGRLPFTDPDPMALLLAQVSEDAPELAEVAPNVPSRLAEVTMKAIAKNPDDRYPTAEDFGVALAEAASDSWEPGWLQQSQLPVMGSTRMVAVTQQATAGADVQGEGQSSASRAAPTSAPRQRTGPRPATTGRPRPRTVAAPTTVIRAQAPTGHLKGADPSAVGAQDLVAIDEVVKLPPFPTPAVLTAIGLLLVCFALAFVGLGSASVSAGNIPPGTIKVAGVAVTPKSVVTLDLAQPVNVTGALPAASAGADKVKLAFSAGGVPLGNATGPVSAESGGQFSSSVDLSSFKYIVAGRTVAKLTFENNGATTASTSFKAKAKQSPFLTVPGVIAIAAVLFAIAYAESLLRALRRRRKQITGPVGLVLLGVLVGVIAVVWAWLIASVDPTTTALIVCGVCGAGCGLAAGVAGIRMGKYRRQRRRAAATRG